MSEPLTDDIGVRRRRRLQSRRKWERVDSAQAYRAQEARSRSLPPEVKSPVEMLAGAAEQQQNVSSIYLATESAPASPFGSLQSAVSLTPAPGNSSWDASGVSRPAGRNSKLLHSVPHAFKHLFMAVAAVCKRHSRM